MVSGVAPPSTGCAKAVDALAALSTTVVVASRLQPNLRGSARSLQAGIEHQPRQGVADHRERKYRACHQAEQRHEPATVDWPRAVLGALVRHALQRRP